MAGFGLHSDPIHLKVDINFRYENVVLKYFFDSLGFFFISQFTEIKLVVEQRPDLFPVQHALLTIDEFARQWLPLLLKN